MFENLSERLERSFKILKGQGRITEINVAETLKEVRRALLDADVNYKTAKEFTETVKAKALGQDVLNAVRPEQMMVKIVHDELAILMGAPGGVQYQEVPPLSSCRVSRGQVRPPSPVSWPTCLRASGAEPVAGRRRRLPSRCHRTVESAG